MEPVSDEQVSGRPDKRAINVITFRLSNKQLGYLNTALSILDCEKSEAFRRAIRLLNLSLSGHNSVLTITKRDGTTVDVPIVIDGIPI